jgi:hypothetical protein
MTPPSSDPLAALQAGLDAYRAQTLGVAEFSDLARAQAARLSDLPPAFGPVLEQLLDRLASSDLFREESCSFSQSGMLDSLQLWIDKARQRLGR